MMIEPATLIASVIALCSAVGAAITVLTFWMRFSDRTTALEAQAENALHAAAEAENIAKDAHKQVVDAERRLHQEIKESNERLTALAAQFALYREQAVEKFASFTAINEMEKRLMESQAKGEQRMVDAIGGINKRLDRLIEAGLAAATAGNT